MTRGRRIQYIRKYYLDVTQDKFYYDVLGYQRSTSNCGSKYLSNIENERRKLRESTLSDYADSINKYIKRERPDLLPINPDFLMGKSDHINGNSVLSFAVNQFTLERNSIPDTIKNMLPVIQSFNIQIAPVYGSFDELRELQGVEDDYVVTTLDRAFPKVNEGKKRHVIKVAVDGVEMTTDIFTEYVLSLQNVLSMAVVHETTLYKKIAAR